MENFVGVEGFEGYFINPQGVVIGVKGHALKQSLNVDGYPIVYMRKGGKNCCVRVHRMLAKAFIPNPENLPVVNHIDGDKTNYDLDNLEWVTVQENVRHSLEELGNVPMHLAKIQEEDVRIICSMLESGKQIRQVIKETSYPKDIIYRIANKQTWTYISSEYKLPENEGRLYKDVLVEICELLNKGFTPTCIVKELNNPCVTRSVVSKISNFKTYTEFTQSILLPKEERPSTSRKA